jgi:hypothetical protein
MTGYGSYPHTQDSQVMLDSTKSDPDFVNTIITGNKSWVNGYDREPLILLIMKNPTRALNTTSLKYWLPSTDAIDRRGK